MSTSSALPAPGSDRRPYLEHLEWVRALALRIVGDPEEADELRQEVWLLAQRLQAPRRVPSKAWLGGLLRNVVRERRRSRAIRTAHEERAALERALDASELPIVREVSIQQVVVECVMAMPDPYRTTVLARYFEDLAPAEIAERDGVPVATVKTRLRRALSALREDLGELQVRGVSALAVLALSVWRPERAAAAGAAASASTVVASVALVAVAAAFVVGVRALVAPTGGVGEQHDSRSVATAEGDAPDGVTIESARTPAAPAAPAPNAGPDAEATAGRVRATVVDLAGQPVPGARLRWVEIADGGPVRRAPWTRSDSRGAAVLPQSTGAGAVECVLDGWLQFGIPLVQRSTRDALLVMAPAVEVRGVVIDAAGAPIAGARVEVGLLGAYAARIGRPLDGVAFERFATRADADGRFTLTAPRDDRGLGARVSSVGHHVLGALVPASDLGADQEFVLRPLTGDGVLFGQVVDADGDPIERAWVAAGGVVARADARGAFQIGADPDAVEVLAGAPGRRPVRVPAEGAEPPLRIVLTELALTIEGVAVDASGDPAGGLVVMPSDCTPAGVYGFSQAGRRMAVEAPLESFGQPDDRGVAPPPVLAVTASDGTFRIEGLGARSYALEILDPRTLARAAAGAHEAGARGVVLRAPAPPPAVEFVVRDVDGRPIEGVRVRASMNGRGELDGGLSQVSGVDGRVRFPSLAGTAFLRARASDDWTHAPIQAAEVARAGSLPLEPAARVQLVVPAGRGALERGRAPRSFEVRDAGGEPLDLVAVDLDAGRTTRSLEFGAPIGDELRPLPFLVSTRARELVLLDARGPLLVLPVDLEQGERALVRP